MTARGIPAWLGKFKIPVWIILGLVILYAILGFWIAPYLIQSKLPAILEEQLGRSGSIREVSFNPFLFKLDLKGFSVQRKQGGPFVGFEELFVDLEWSSLIKRAVAFDQIRLIGPFVEVDKDKAGRFNFDDLLTDSEEEEPDPESGDSSPFPVWISHLEIGEGRLIFTDQSHQSAFRSEISPIDLSISDFQTYLDTGSQYQFKANIASGGTFDWRGEINISPLRSNGLIKLSGFKPILLWRYIQDTVNFEVASGAFDLNARYRLQQQDGAIQVEVSEGKYHLENLKIARKGDPDPVIDIPSLILDGITFDLLGQKLSIASLSSEKAKIRAWVQPDKEMNFVELFTPITNSPASVKSPPSTPNKKSDNSQWLVTVGKIALSQYGFLFEDRSLATTARLNFMPLDVTLNNFSSDLAGTLPFTIKTTINQTGHLNVKGDLGLTPVSTIANLDLKLNLPDFQPYIDPVTKLEFERGDALVQGDVDFKLDQAAKPQLKFSGTASIDGFLGQDKVQHEKLLEWKTLKFDGVDFNLDPIQVAIKEVVANQAYTRFIINADGSTNISKVFGDGSSAAASTQKSAVSDEEGVKQGPDPLVTVAKVTIKNTSANFADYSLKPKFATGIENLNGDIQGLSTDKNARAKINLKGTADQTAPVRIKGQIQVFDPESYTDIGLDFKNLSLTSLTPYSGKFAGYKIEKGKMSVNLKYRVDRKKLTAENEVVIKQLTLGDEVESPDAVSLPLSLAIALLQDANGVINIDLPLNGSLDNPEFSIWGTVGDVLFNLISKVVTSPFAALGSLINDDEQLDTIAFSPGRPDMAADETEKLGKVAEALAQRPALNVEVEGVANEADAEARFRNEILTSKKALDTQQPSGNENQTKPVQPKPTLTDDDFKRHLLQTYYMQITGMKNLALNAPMIEQNLNAEDVLRSARRKVYGTMLSDDPSLRDLAQSRAREIRENLIAQGLNPDRIFMLDVNLERSEENDSEVDGVVVSKLALTTN